MKVKICGIRTPEEAEKVLKYSPDAIGIIGLSPHVAKNYVEPIVARKIVNSVLSRIETFLLLNDSDYKSISSYYKEVKSSAIQLIGDIKPEDIIKLKNSLPGIKLIKVIHITSEEAVDLAKTYEDCNAVNELLLDSKIGNKLGGTGKVHNWDISRRIVESSKKPVWLAGGLNTGNLEEAIKTVRPYGVDVETGVQNPDGSKDYEEIKKFISIAHSY